MKRTAVGFAILGLALSGCNDETQQSVEAQGGSGDLYFSYPTKGQQSTPTSAPVFLRFGGEVSASEEALKDALLLTEQTSEGGQIGFESVSLLDEGRGLRAEPETALTPGRSYELSVSGITVANELVNETIEFSTAASDIGPVIERTDLTSESSDFSVARILPYADEAATTVGEGTDEFPVSDLSTFRIQFNEPVNENTLSYGLGDSDTVRLTNSEGELVPAEMLARDHRLTLDPNENLEPGETYELSLSSNIKSHIGDASLQTPDAPWTFTPVTSASSAGERSVMAQKASTDAGKLALTGEDYNSVRLSATTLGDASANQTVQTGTVFAELGYVPSFDQAGKSVPLSIDRGTLMEGSSVAVKVGGEVPSGFESETIDVRFLSDANGYLMPNPYTSDPNAPRLVRLFLDLSMNTGEARANGALAQELLHVELVGTAMVEDGTLTMEAVSVIEPDVLGVDKASGLISFRLEDDPNAAEPSAFADTTAPSLKSWAPGKDHQDKLQPQDSVSLFFNEPLLPSSVTPDTVTLRDSEGTRVASDIRQNGGNVIIDPASPLQYDKDYEIILDGDVLQDLAGNKLGGLSENLSFSLPDTEPGTPSDVGPLVLTARPGYPCAKADLDLADDKNGRCLGGITEDAPPSEHYPEDDPGTRAPDEFLPIERHGLNDPIIVRFSQNMDTDTITAGESFTIEKRTSENNWETVEGFVLEKDSRQVRAIPMESWEKGATYRYTLKDGIQSAAGVPLYTELLQQYDKDSPSDLDTRLQKLTQGGPAMVNRFQAVAPDEQVLTPLSNLPSLDANSNLALDPAEIVDGMEETPANAASMQMGNVDSDVVADADIGCKLLEDSDGNPKKDPDCAPINRMIFKTAKLDVQVGPDPVTRDGKTGIPVKLHPSVLHTSSSDVWIQLDNDFLAEIATEDGDKNQRIPTGPMVMRMRYQEGSSDRSELIDGLIYSENGQLRFKTKLDVYLDAPFLLSRLSSNFSETNLEDNMRSFEINDLTLDGPITFFDDGRMQIVQRNIDPINLDITLRGEVTAEFLNDDCGLFQIFCDAVNDLVNVVVDVDTDMAMKIPENGLYLNYISPYTQKRE